MKIFQNVTHRKLVYSFLLVIAIYLFSPLTAFAKQTVKKPHKKAVLSSMKAVADWQIKEPLRHKLYDWTNGALYAGMMAYGRIAKEDTYINRMREIGEKISWKIGPRKYFADDYCVAQMFCEMYQIDGDAKVISNFREVADSLIAQPHTESLEWLNNVHLREWAWCDALFMGPPALAELYKVTGDIRYLNLTSKLWWKTTDYLYNKSDSLFFRDSSFFPKREKNGRNIYWSRGNGWVMGGLVRVLETMPKDYPDYPRFIALYKEMAQKIASIQQPDGAWHASLLDPASFPIKETSGTGFFCFALAWGVNHGILDKEQYSPIVYKAWAALTSSVHENGKLGYVQRIGASPDGVTENDTEVYGVGAFLLAGTEILDMIKKN